MQSVLGTKLPLFGTYNAGEIGPADVTERTCRFRPFHRWAGRVET
jgi:hypothetical protein